MTQQQTDANLTPRSAAPATGLAPFRPDTSFPPLTDQAVLMITAGGTIEYCSGPARLLLKAASHRLKGKHLSALMPCLPLRAATPGYNCAYLVFNHPAGSWHGVTVKTDDGEMTPLEASFLFIPSGKNDTRLLVGLRSPTAPAPAEVHFLRFLEQMEERVEAVVVTDAREIIEYVNGAYERLSGWARHELVGRKRLSSMPAALPSSSNTDGLIRHSPRAERRRSGEMLYLDEQVRPFTDRAGRVTHYVSMSRDVTRCVADQKVLQRRGDAGGLQGIANRHPLSGACSWRSREQLGKLAHSQ